MKTHITLCLTFFLALLCLACEDPKGPAFVYGRGSVNPGGRDDSIHGTLAKSSGTDYYGECRYANGEFSFTVAHAKLENLSGTLTADTPIFLRFSGIKGAQANDGAPNDGVFDPATGQPWYRTEYHGSFARATVASGGEVFNFTSSEGGCRVELFATPISGELIRDINKSFDYYVRINCAGMSEVKGTNNPSVSLLTVEADFYFDNC